MDIMREIMDFLGKIIDKHVEQLKEMNVSLEEKNQNRWNFLFQTTQIEARDFIEAFLIEQQKCEESGETHFFS
jgi:hypothetical protein